MSRTRLLIVALLVLAAIPLGAMTVGAQGSYVCFPTCSETDGRFLALAGTGIATLAGDEVLVQLVADKSATRLVVEIFDGDTGGRWDVPGPESEYALFMDPAGDYSGSGGLVGTWYGHNMPDNGWYVIDISTTPGAKSGSGYYYYVLKVRNTDPTRLGRNSFKARTQGVVILAPQAFSVIGAVRGLDDALVIYPEYPNLNVTTYDGNWDFFLEIPASTSSLAVWDGDLDYGSWDGQTTKDTDDPDTPNDSLPEWAAGTDAVFEGVADGYLNTTGDPPDDYPTLFYRREPSITYQVIAPDGRTFTNDNPSGNLEWEQFRIDSDPAVPADYHVSGLLPAGVYRVHVSGMDLGNLNAWRFSYKTLCVRADGTPCVNVDPYLVGDLVWRDTNGNGTQDSGENGIAGVQVNLLDSNGQIIKTAFTDANGIYTFEVVPGTYTVQVAPENLNSGQPLFGLVSTTGGESQTNTVTNANILTYDFGYRPVLIGDLVWRDTNENGTYETGEPGIANVTVNLLDGNNQVIGTTTTNANGLYSFAVTPNASYTVQIAAGNFDSGQPLYGLVSTTGGESQTKNVGTDNVLTYDFGYRPRPAAPPVRIGDLVWMDSNDNGLYEPALGEIGIANVKVNLLNSSGQVIGTTTTDANGLYQFLVAPNASYTVQIASENFNNGKPLFGLVSTTGGESQTKAVGTVSRFDYDFGYRPVPTAPGTGTPGYWKNHPEAWPVAAINIGGRIYTKEQAIALMNMPDGDKSYTLFRALVCAELNVIMGNEYGCIASILPAAHDWMAAHPVGSKVKANSQAWKVGEPLYLTLDKYNNGLLCAPHRD